MQPFRQSAAGRDGIRHGPFLLMLVMALAAEPAWAQKMKNYARSLAKQCYRDERILDSTESALLGKDKVTTAPKCF